MAALDTEQVTSSGLEATANAATAAGDTVRPGSILRVNNGGESPVTVTLAMANPASVDGNAVADKEITVPNGEARYIYVSDYYRDKSTGRATVTYSADTSVTVEVIRA